MCRHNDNQEIFAWWKLELTGAITVFKKGGHRKLWPQDWLSLLALNRGSCYYLVLVICVDRGFSPFYHCSEDYKNEVVQRIDGA